MLTLRIVLSKAIRTLARAGVETPRLDAEGVDLYIYYVSSAELFNALPAAEQERFLRTAAKIFSRITLRFKWKATVR